MKYTRFLEKEDYRIDEHLQGAVRLLNSADTSSYHNFQMRQRKKLIQDLNRYIHLRIYPRNIDFTSNKPYIRDNEGRLCALAYLISETGNQELVEELVKNENNALVKEFTNPHIAQWLVDHGLSSEEAARIQPAYGDPVSSIFNLIAAFSVNYIFPILSIFLVLRVMGGYFGRGESSILDASEELLQD